MTFTLPRKTIAGLVAAVGAAAVIGGGSAGAVPTVSGSVGPGFTISLKRGGKTVKKLNNVTYKFRVKDRSSEHSFHLRGPGGVNRIITGETFTGTKAVSIRLRKGTYRYFCDPHPDDMKGSFKVD